MSRVVVIGAGAAGTMAAIFAASHGAETLLLERTRDGGRKILISGGGRCNILPARVDESRFVTDSSPHTLRRIVRSWPLGEQIDFFERDAAIPLMEEPASAKLFPKSESARDVRDKLLALARAKGVTIATGTVVTGVEPVGRAGLYAPAQYGSADPGPADPRWRITQHDGPPILADAVIVATGGLSVPATGSDGLGLTFVERLGHTINKTYAALTPLIRLQADTTYPSTDFSTLAGVSLPLTLTARARDLTSTATGGFLFTHDGYSGPAVLDISHVAVRSRGEMEAPARIAVRWTALDDADWETALRPVGARTVLNAVSAHLPGRLAEALVASAGVDLRRKLAQLTRDERSRLIGTLVRGELPWTGDEGYKKAEVTGGGVALSEIDARTMESRRHPGLFLCGEMLDAFGPIGGYNFLWAWATGRAAGIGAASK